MAAALRLVERHHWVNTYLGVLDSSYHLTEDEQYYVSTMIVHLLDYLEIPGRSEPQTLPAAVVLEAESAFFTVGLYGPRDSGVARPAREVGSADLPVSVEAWCQAMVGMLRAAYPDLQPEETVYATKVFSDALTGLGVPRRAAFAYPSSVIRSYWETDEI